MIKHLFEESSKVEQGEAIGFNVLRRQAVEDIRRFMLGLPLEPSQSEAVRAIRSALKQFSRNLVQEAVDAVHLSDRGQLLATTRRGRRGWIARRGSYVVRNRLYESRDRRRASKRWWDQ